MLIILPILILVIVLTALVVMYVLLVKATYGHLYGNFASTLTAKSRQAAPVSVVDVVEPIETSSVEDDISDDTKESEPEKEAYVPAFADDSCESDDETETQESEYLPLN